MSKAAVLNSIEAKVRFCVSDPVVTRKDQDPDAGCDASADLNDMTSSGTYLPDTWQDAIETLESGAIGNI